MLDEDRLIHCHLIEIETPVSVLRFSTTGWRLDWDGKTWSPGDGIQEVELPAENPNLEALNSKIVIPALNPATTSLALSVNLHGRYAAIWHAVFDPETYRIAGSAKVFSGRVSHLSLKTAAVSV